MVGLRFATKTEAEPETDTIDCSWSSVIHGIERYAAYQPASTAQDLRQSADLLEGIRQLRKTD
jgi:hypothetical protein